MIAVVCTGPPLRTVCCDAPAPGWLTIRPEQPAALSTAPGCRRAPVQFERLQLVPA